MKKNLLYTTFFLLTGLLLQAQPAFLQGSEKPFTFKKQPTVAALQNNGSTYFVFKSYDFAAPFSTLVAVNSTGNITSVAEAKYQRGTMGNMTEMLQVVSFQNQLYGVMENRNKSTNVNQLTLQPLDGQGNPATTETEAGSFTFEKMGKSGDWYVSATPDGKHLAVVAQLPAEKEQLIQFKYYWIGSDLKAASAGQFTFPELTKKVYVNSFQVSNEGDFYFIKTESDKTYSFPLVYRAKTGAPTGSVIPVQADDPKQKLANYVSAVLPNGDLALAGYLINKSGFTIGDVQAIGSWFYPLSAAKMSTALFSKPVSNATAEGIVPNGNTIYLVGEQLKTEMEQRTAQQSLAFEENYNYTHKDILVTAFSAEGAKKFDLNLPRTLKARNFNQDLYPAYGIVNNKLAIVYNDQYGKYIPNTAYDSYKLPMLTYITNDGLMEAPLHFEKEFQTTHTTYTLYPQFFVNSNGGILMLAGNGSSIKGVVVK